ncbi:hypothetical protein SU48_03870 [Deinococcus puniceus]|uniref:Peptidase S8/S53 domain-containing protein n=2 Tax=Deinococcus puniceus TaxID=1182568 RepID=A0A172T7M6_9DEIO|nr:hypothetical protein SU48_03870 [Deinococcus puniceus]
MLPEGVLNTLPTVSAPGVFYFPSAPAQLALGDQRLAFWGTSFASPLVTGLLAEWMHSGETTVPSMWQDNVSLIK